MNEVTLPELLTNEQAAKYLHVKPHTLDVWRCEGRNPIPYVKVGGRVRYRAADLQSYIESNLQACA